MHKIFANTEIAPPKRVFRCRALVDRVAGYPVPVGDNNLLQPVETGQVFAAKTGQQDFVEPGKNFEELAFHRQQQGRNILITFRIVIWNAYE